MKIRKNLSEILELEERIKTILQKESASEIQKESVEKTMVIPAMTFGDSTYENTYSKGRWK